MALLSALVLALGLGEAGGPIQLVWDAEPGCPGPGELERALGRYLTGPIEQADPATVVGHIVARGPSFVLELDIRAAGIVEHHELSAATCGELGEAAGLLIAGVVEPLVFASSPDFGPSPGAARAAVRGDAESPRPDDPGTGTAGEVRRAAPGQGLADARHELDRTSAAPASAPSVELERVTTGAVDRARRRERARSWAPLLHVSGGAMANLLPRPGGGARLGARAERGALRLGGGLDGWFGPGFRADDDPAVGGQLWAGSAVFTVCGVPERRRVSFPLCAEAGAGLMRGRGVGVDTPQVTTLPWVWLGADAGIEWWLGDRVAITMGVAIIGSLARPAFDIAGSSASYETPPVSARAQLGLVIRFDSKRRSAAKIGRTQLSAERP